MQETSVEIRDMIALVRDGTREGFSKLYAKYAAALYGILYRITGDKATAENLLEATFVCICKHIDDYRGENSFFSWLIHMAQSIGHEHMAREGKPECAGSHRHAMELIFFGGYTYDETAKHMNVSEEVVKADVRNRLKTWR